MNRLQHLPRFCLPLERLLAGLASSRNALVELQAIAIEIKDPDLPRQLGQMIEHVDSMKDTFSTMKAVADSVARSRPN